MFYFYRCYIDTNYINVDGFNFKSDKFFLIWLSTFGKPQFFRSEVSAAEYKTICLYDKFTPINIIFDKYGNFNKLYFMEENLMKSVFLGCYSKDYDFTNEKGSFSGTTFYLVHGEIRENKVNYPVKQKINKIIYDSIKSFPFGTSINVDYVPFGNDMRIASVTKN